MLADKVNNKARTGNSFVVRKIANSIRPKGRDFIQRQKAQPLLKQKLTPFSLLRKIISPPPGVLVKLKDSRADHGLRAYTD